MSDEGVSALTACPVACEMCECADDGEWYKAGKPEKGCNWIAEDPEDRCAAGVVGEDGTDAHVACALTCGECGCQDSYAWRYKGKSSKDCSWVAKKVGAGGGGGGGGSLFPPPPPSPPSQPLPAEQVLLVEV